MGEIKKNPLLTLFLISIPISCIHQFYFFHTAGFLGQFQAAAEASNGPSSTKGLFHAINAIFGAGGGGLMTVGQIAEFCVLAMMPILAKALSRKTLLAIGIIAYGLRMFLFAYVDAIVAATHISPVPILIVGIAMHGFSFGCFVFVAFMVVDEQTTGDVRRERSKLVQPGDDRRRNHCRQQNCRHGGRVGQDRQRSPRLHEAIQRANVGLRGMPDCADDFLPAKKPRRCLNGR